MNVGSLFAGIGGFDLGLERAGFEIAWQVELDPFCRAVLACRFPEAEHFEDVREVGAAELCPVDLLCGGFPCQDLSVAGGGAGLEGARSGLWAEFADSFASWDPVTSSWRTSRPSSPGRGRGGTGRRSEEFSATWPRQGMTRSGRAFPLASSGHPTCADGFGSSPTPAFIFPTPSATEPSAWRYLELVDKEGNPPSHPNQRFYDRRTGRVVQKTLEHIALTWPTPTVTDARKGYSSAPGPGNGRGRQTLSGAVHSRSGRRGPRGHLNPEWVEWLMGFPIGWTASPPSATRSSRRSPSGSGGASSNMRGGR